MWALIYKAFPSLPCSASICVHLKHHANALQLYVEQLAALLLRAGGDPDSPAGLQVTQRMAKVHLLFGSKAQLNPQGMREILAKTRSCCAVLPPPKPWRGIIAMMSLREEQRLTLLRVRRLYLLAQGQLLRSRKHIITQIQASKDFHELLSLLPMGHCNCEMLQQSLYPSAG